MTVEQNKQYIAALLFERAGYEQYGNDDGVAAVDAELERLGHEVKPPQQRATKMTPKGRTEV